MSATSDKNSNTSTAELPQQASASAIVPQQATGLKPNTTMMPNQQSHNLQQQYGRPVMVAPGPNGSPHVHLGPALSYPAPALFAAGAPKQVSVLGGTGGPVGTLYPAVQKKKRKLKMKRNCEPCTRAKVKCDGEQPCSRCVARGQTHSCEFLHKKSRWDKNGNYDSGITISPSEGTATWSGDAMNPAQPNSNPSTMKRAPFLPAAAPIVTPEMSIPSGMQFMASQGGFQHQVQQPMQPVAGPQQPLLQPAAAPMPQLAPVLPQPSQLRPVPQHQPQLQLQPQQQHAEVMGPALKVDNVQVASILTAGHIICQTIQYESALQLSDPALKHNIRPLDDYSSDLMHIHPVQFQWKVSGRRAIGFLADEVQRHLPGCVREDQSGTKMIDGSALATVAIQALKNHNSRMKELEREMTWTKILVVCLGVAFTYVATQMVAW